jgi:hypothetical protein
VVDNQGICIAGRSSKLSEAKECERERARGERERERKLKDEAAPYVKEGNQVNSKRLKVNIHRVKKELNTYQV